MENLFLAYMYATLGTGFGVAESVGSGLPSKAAGTWCGFEWPTGSVIVKDGQRWQVNDDTVVQID